MSVGFILPFTVSTGSTGYFETSSDALVATEQDIRSLLLTNWGERPMRYFLGCNLRSFLFENIVSDETKAKIADMILGQMDRWLPFVRVKELNILLSDDDASIPENKIRIKMRFSLTREPDVFRSLNVIGP
jgi:phage baseplate assembly protein W